MGLIKKQTIKGSIYSYLGIALGFLVTIISLKILTSEQIGLTAILVAVSGVYSQFSTLGFTKVTERLFPYFRDIDKNHNGFMFITLSVGFIGFSISLITFLILKPYIVERNIENSSLLVDFIWYLVPLIFFRMFFNLLDSYNKMLFDATSGTLLSDFVYRAGNLLLLGAYFLNWINFSQFVFGFVFFLCLPAIYLALLLIYRKQFHIKPNTEFIKPPLRKEMISLSAFGIIGGVSSVALKQIDTIMLNEYTDLATAGIYSIIFYFHTVILIPSVALGKISSTIIADAWKNKDKTMIDDIYYKSSINQMFVSLLLFILVVSNLHNIIAVLGTNYIGTEWVIIFISLSSLIISSTGSSVQIIGTSHKYKIQTYSLGFLMILSVIFYRIFIPLLGMEGAALGSMLSLSGASLLRVFYLKKSMNLFPYKTTHLKCLAFGIIAWILTYLIPVIDFLLLDLFIRSLAISVIFIGFCYLFKISDDLNKVGNHLLKMLHLKS